MRLKIVSVRNYLEQECQSSLPFLLGFKLDWKLNVDAQIFYICKRARGKLNAIVRIAPFIGLSKKRIPKNVFFDCQFSYCPLIWMCYSRTNNEKMNRLHERCSHFIYNDQQSQFSKLLEMDGSVFIHIRNTESLAIEMFRDSRNLSLPIMNDIFTQNVNSRYSLR